MQAVQTAGILFVSFAKYKSGATNRNRFYVHSVISLTIFVVIPVLYLVRLCFFLKKYNLNVFSYWLISYVLVGIFMAVWFFTSLSAVYE